MYMKSITFLSPSRINIPSGGIKIILEHANKLAQEGHNVTIECPYILDWKEKNLIDLLRAIKNYLKIKFFEKWDCYDWFPLDKRVELKWTFSLNYCFIKKTDIYIATAVQTAPFLNKYPIEKVQKYYFIQDYENWYIKDEDVRKTYHYGLNKIAITQWLVDIIEKEEKEECFLVPNGFNFDQYRITIPIKKKEKHTISMLYHTDDRKDIPTAISALNLVKKKIPELQVLLFGTKPKPQLPNWFHYYYCPTFEQHLEINNRAAIYIGSSKVEGFGLTVGEAMLCGQAVACTNNAGYQEMAKNGYTALVSPIKDPQALANNIIRLINNNELRFQLALNGYNYIRSNFSWEQSHKLFYKALNLY